MYEKCPKVPENVSHSGSIYDKTEKIYKFQGQEKTLEEAHYYE